jgi:hypothetical protein
MLNMYMIYEHLTIYDNLRIMLLLFLDLNIIF